MVKLSADRICINQLARGNILKAKQYVGYWYNAALPTTVGR